MSDYSAKNYINSIFETLKSLSDKYRPVEEKQKEDFDVAWRGVLNQVHVIRGIIDDTDIEVKGEKIFPSIGGYRTKVEKIVNDLTLKALPDVIENFSYQIENDSRLNFIPKDDINMKELTKLFWELRNYKHDEKPNLSPSP